MKGIITGALILFMLIPTIFYLTLWWKEKVCIGANDFKGIEEK